MANSVTDSLPASPAQWPAGAEFPALKSLRFSRHDTVVQDFCIKPAFFDMQLYDSQGRRLYLTDDERKAFMAAARKAPRDVRSLCSVLHHTGCRISEALALTPRSVDLSGKVIVFESLKKRKRGVYRAVPVPPELLDTLDMVHGVREIKKRAAGGLGV